MPRYIALIRGINVGRGKRVAMADLRKLMVDLGHTNVRTLMNSGNLIFQSKRPKVAKISASIAAAIDAKCGFAAAVMVMSAQDFDRIVDENPLLHMVKDHSRHLVAFVSDAKHLEPLRPMLVEPWTPDALGITERAAFLWCATGILEGKIIQAFSRKAGATVTTRNWATVLKLQAAAKEAI